jgi:hypothetical protein
LSRFISLTSGYDRHICASIIANQDNWQELLRTIGIGPLQRNVAIVVWQIREALDQDAEYAREIKVRLKERVRALKKQARRDK